MEENEIIENIEEVATPLPLDDGSDGETPQAEKTTNELLQEIANALTSSDEMGNDVITEENLEAENAPTLGENSDTPIYINFDEFMEFIREQNYATREDINLLLENSNRTIFDKELNEYNVSESFLLIGIFTLVFSLMCKSMERIYLKWR